MLEKILFYFLQIESHKFIVLFLHFISSFILEEEADCTCVCVCLYCVNIAHIAMSSLICRFPLRDFIFPSNLCPVPVHTCTGTSMSVRKKVQLEMNYG